MGLIKRMHEGRQLHPNAVFPTRRAWCRKHKFNLIRAAVLASSVALMLPGAWGHSVTAVEFAHLPAGLAAWQSRSLRIYRVCGPVSKLLYALPTYLIGFHVDYPALFEEEIAGRQEWEVGRLFQSQNIERYHDIYRWSRLLPMLLTVLGGCLVCEWSTRLFGTCPGIVFLCMWCWLPPILAHGSLITSDMPATVLLLVSARSFWSFLLRPSKTGALLAGASLGLACATKFTLLILCPCWIVLLLIRATQSSDLRADGRPDRAGLSLRLLVLGLAMIGTSVVVLNASYGFRDVGFSISNWGYGRSSFATSLNLLDKSAATAWLTRIPSPIPLEFFRGLDIQLADTERLQSAYLLGRTQPGGWWYWYAAAFLLKIPLPAIVLYAISLASLPAAWRRSEPVLWASLCLLLPATELALTVSATTGTGTNAAFRYLLPSLAMLCVATGSAWGRSTICRKIANAGLLCWLLLDASAAVPDHIGSQNESAWAWRQFAGRPALIGDSLDWGQDLARLGEWVSRHSDEGCILVCAHGLGLGEPYGLRPPGAEAIQEPPQQASYLALSEEIVYGNQISNDVAIAGVYPTLDPGIARKVLNLEPTERIGRTIRIYRLRDLSPAHRGHN